MSLRPWLIGYRRRDQHIHRRSVTSQKNGHRCENIKIINSPLPLALHTGLSVPRNWQTQMRFWEVHTIQLRPLSFLTPVTSRDWHKKLTGFSCPVHNIYMFQNWAHSTIETILKCGLKVCVQRDLKPVHVVSGTSVFLSQIRLSTSERVNITINKNFREAVFPRRASFAIISLWRVGNIAATNSHTHSVAAVSSKLGRVWCWRYVSINITQHILFLSCSRLLKIL
jgi:hypothetical protein